MPIRLHEIHPMLVHLPLALLPAAIVSDALTGARRDAPGRVLITAAASGLALAAASGLVAQNVVRAHGRAHDVLVTHRSLNALLLGAVSGLAGYRSSHEPGRLYLAAGAGAVALMLLSAKLGGELVYTHGVGVAAAGGTKPDAEPVFGHRPGLVRRTARHLREALRHAAQHAREGQIAPALRSPAAPETERRVRLPQRDDGPDDPFEIGPDGANFERYAG